MYQIIKKLIRPNTDIPFYFELPPTDLIINFYEYFKNNYINTGKLQKTTRDYSSDKLTVIQTQYWDCRESVLMSTMDNICYDNLLIVMKYNEQNGIKSEFIGIVQTSTDQV